MNAQAGQPTDRHRSESDAAELPVLWHLKVSNYNEKARWALDHKNIPHIRRAAVPGQHRAKARQLTGGDTFPVLILVGQAIGDSTRIIEELEHRWPDPPLYPADPQERREALELEEFFDDDLGPYARQLILYCVLPDPKLMLGVFVPDLRALRYLLARASYPVLRRRVVADFDVNEESAAYAYEKLAAAGGRFRDACGPSGYLVGNRFSVADLTLASLIAPLVAPSEFPYPQPQRDHPRLAQLREALHRVGLLDWTREMYVRHRPMSAEVGGRTSS